MARPRPTSDRAKTAVALAASVVFWLAAWQMASMAFAQPLLLPGPIEVVAALARDVLAPSFWSAVGFSSLRILGGLLAAYLLALPAAAAAHRVFAVRALLTPPLQAIKATPVVCVVVLLLLWAGSANVSFAAVLLMALPGLYFTVFEGLGRQDGRMAELFEVHRVRGLRRMLAGIWQQVLPYVLAASSNVVGMAWKAGVAAELIGVPLGSMGERIYQAKLLIETADVLAWTVAVVALAALSERIVMGLIGYSGRTALRLALRMGRLRSCARSGFRAHSGPRAHSGQTDDGAGGLVTMSGAIAPYSPTVPMDMSLARGERVCLMAPSGTGKTTCLRMVAGLVRPVCGEVSVSCRVSVQFQDARLIEFASALENVLLFAAGGISEAAVERMLTELVGAIDVHAPVATLSGGQRRRVELLRALLVPSDVVLLDEPFAGLDEEAHRRAAAWVGEHLDGRALIVATHDPRDAELLGAVVHTMEPSGELR